MATNGVTLPATFFQQEDSTLRPSFTAASYGGFQ
jgi:hypothetical protein